MNTKDYKEYLDGHSNLKSLDHNTSKGDDWAAYLYGDRVQDFYRLGEKDVALIGHEKLSRGHTDD